MIGSRYIVFFTEFFAERRTHDDAFLAGGSAEVGFSRFSARGRQTCEEERLGFKA
jgi:hypothetical protein